MHAPQAPIYFFASVSAFIGGALASLIGWLAGVDGLVTTGLAVAALGGVGAFAILTRYSD